MSKTKIEYVDLTINPMVGCSKCSPGCDNCYAERMAARLSKNPLTAAKYAGVVDANGKWTGQINFDLSCFDKLPKKPQRIFIGSMTDIFHDNVEKYALTILLSRMGDKIQHTFMVLTKRAARMQSFMSECHLSAYPNIWLGVTVCNQAEADEKIPLLLATPAAKRFVSVEPMLGPVDLAAFLGAENERIERRVCSQSCDSRRTGDRQERSNMEGGLQAREQAQRRHNNNTLQKTESGTHDGHWLPPGEGNDRGKACSCPSAPSCLAPLQWQNSRRFDNKPQEREQERQQSGELRNCNDVRTIDTRIFHGIEDTERREESGSKISRQGHSCNSKPLCGRKNDATGNCEKVFSFTPDGIENCKDGKKEGISWIIAGGETGPGARPMHPDWVRSLRDQCHSAEVPFFFKGMIENGKKTRLLDGREWNEVPE